MMERGRDRLAYLLDASVIAELSRPNGNRRVFTLFQERQSRCALAAPTVYGLLRGVDSLISGPRRALLSAFLQELLRSGPPVLAYDGPAAVWLARESQRRRRDFARWTAIESELAAIAATRDLTLVTRSPQTYAGTEGLKLEDWFRP
jgi:predicted nucleic acid-binding protein